MLYAIIPPIFNALWCLDQSLWKGWKRPPKYYNEIKSAVLIRLTLLPTGGLFGPHHLTGSQNSRTLSLRVYKISDFFFMPFGHIVAKFQVDWSARGLLQSFFEQEVMKNKGYEYFCFCLKWLKFVAGYNLGSWKQLLAIKVSLRINKPVENRVKMSLPWQQR